LWFSPLDSFGARYFTLLNSSPGTIFIGTQIEKHGYYGELNKFQKGGSPILKSLQQDHFSFDMDLCDVVAITNGSFVVEYGPTKSGNFKSTEAVYLRSITFSHLFRITVTVLGLII
jgi:hypothetical protein